MHTADVQRPGRPAVDVIVAAVVVVVVIVVVVIVVVQVGATAKYRLLAIDHVESMAIRPSALRISFGF